jgi:hypothetical protein
MLLRSAWVAFDPDEMVAQRGAGVVGAEHAALLQ